MRCVIPLGAVFAVLLNPIGALGADPDAALSIWLASQTNVTSWQADFRQTRTLSTLAEPLTARGRVRFAAPDRFHWQLGDPPQTVAIRQPQRVVIVYPKLKRAEEYPLHAEAKGPWKDALALLDAGFPRSRGDLEKRFQLQSLRETEAGHYTLTLEPRAPSARKLLAEVQLVFSLEPARLLATQMKFPDGSALRNDFTNVVVNEKLDASVFEPEIGADFKITRPAGRR